jgi:hypothetical protein
MALDLAISTGRWRSRGVSLIFISGCLVRVSRASMAHSYPGVYITELPSPVQTIARGGHVDRRIRRYTPRGIDNRAQAIFSFADIERLYGGFASHSDLGYAAAQFHQNAPGQQA